MSRIATISPVMGCSVEDLRTLAKTAEGGGFEAIFSPEVPPFSALTNAQVFAEATSNIKVGTWITNSLCDWLDIEQKHEDSSHQINYVLHLF